MLLFSSTVTMLRRSTTSTRSPFNLPCRCFTAEVRTHGTALKTTFTVEIYTRKGALRYGMALKTTFTVEIYPKRGLADGGVPRTDDSL